MVIILFSYCLAGNEALVCDDEELEVVQVKAQQVDPGEDEKKQGLILSSYCPSQIQMFDSCLFKPDG